MSNLTVTYKEVVVIDDREYVVHRSDHSNDVNEAVRRGLITDDDSQGILDFVTDIITNSN